MPVSLIGTLSAIWLFGFSVNLLTLLALVLAKPAIDPGLPTWLTEPGQLQPLEERHAPPPPPPRHAPPVYPHSS